jgi:hypothetical protein
MIYNALRTPDGTIIQSRHRHDYKEYVDINGKTYMIDGGIDYIHCSDNGDEELLTVYTTDPIEKIRQYLRWGKNYDADGNLLPKTQWVKLCDITDDHLDALCVYPPLSPTYRTIFIREKQLRQSLYELF